MSNRDGTAPAPGKARPAYALSRHAAAYNLRDFGGYRTRGGGVLRAGRLYRSGELDHVHPEDHGLVARLGVACIVDMRSASERGGTPLPALDGFAGEVLVASSDDGLIPHLIRALDGMTGASEVIPHISATYRDLPFRPRFVESLRQMFDALGRPDGATLVHCFAGKDRTGLAVALAHHVLGVHADDAMADYLATNAMGQERVAVGLRRLRRRIPPTVSDDLLREVMAVRAEYLAEAMAAIGEAHGGIDAYLTDRVGLSRDRAEAIAEGLLA